MLPPNSPEENSNSELFDSITSVEFTSEEFDKLTQVNVLEVIQKLKGYYHLFQLANEAMIIVDPESEIIVEVNNQAAEIYQRNRQDFIGRSLKEITSQHLQISQAIKQFINIGSYEEFESIHFRGDGTPFNLVINAAVIEYQGKKLILTINRQVAAYKLLTQQIKDREQHLLAVANSVQDAIVSVNNHGKIILWNEGARKIFGYQEKETIGKSASFLIPIKYHQAYNEIIRSFSEGENSVLGDIEDLQGIRKDGSEFPLEFSLIVGESAQNHYLTSVIRDKTAHKLSLDKIKVKERMLGEKILHQVWTAQPDGKIDYINQAILDYFRKPWEESQDELLKSFIHPEDFQKAINKWTYSLQTGENYEVEYRLKRADGVYCWHLGLATPGYDQEGQINKWYGTNTDIHKQKIAEEILLDSEERFRLLVEGVVDYAIFMLDIEGYVTSWNAGAERVKGYTAEEIIGSHFRIFYITEDQERKYPEEELEIATINGRYEEEGWRLRKNGSKFWAHILITAIRNDKGELKGFTKITRDITERRIAEEAMRKAESSYRSLVESTPGIVYLNEPHPPYATIYISPNIESIGYSPEEWYATPGIGLKIVHKDDLERVKHEFNTVREHGLEIDLEYRIIARDGTTYWWQDTGRYILDEKGNKIGWQGIILNITKTRELEEQLRQSQKLESIALLAGGITHDFNNMLTAINGYSELTLRRLGLDDPIRPYLDEIIKAGHRSADLTQQLLAFSRRQVLKPVITDLNEIILDTIKMLQRLISEDIKLITILNPKLGKVKVDPGQFSQIIMNLTVNARDAMPRGGKLTIETVNVFLDELQIRQYVGLAPGAYVLLIINDTGTGISEETKQHIFDPFFTTKEAGQGTGLGLATVYGIVKQSGGNIKVYSEEGVGTTFTIYLPRAEKMDDILYDQNDDRQMLFGTETILLVEDDEIVRNLFREILKVCGYTVVEALNGSEAIEICEIGDFTFDLLMTDVVIPDMSGQELAEKLIKKLPNLKVLFTSGYTDEAVLRYGIIKEEANFIQKPFMPEDLSGKIRMILDGKIIKS